MNPQSTRQRVLIVDDNEEARALLRLYLKRLDVQVSEAEDGLKALDALRDGRPHLILLDLDMPNLDGFGFLERRGAVSDWQPPVVILSARLDDAARERALTLGAVDYFEKTGAVATQLLPLIRKWLVEAERFLSRETA